jgi:hypothetical protein
MYVIVYVTQSSLRLTIIEKTTFWPYMFASEVLDLVQNVVNFLARSKVYLGPQAK